jgi:predicted nucleotidyltransferase
VQNFPERVVNALSSGKVEFIVVGGVSAVLQAEGESLDLLGEMSAIGGYDAIVGRAIEMEVAGHTVKVLALPDLIRTKRAAGRPKDLAVLPILEATLQMLQDKDGA